MQELFNMIFEEELIKTILNENWNNLNNERILIKNNLEDLINNINAINNRNEKKKIINELPKKIKMYLLIEIADQLKDKTCKNQ